VRNIRNEYTLGDLVGGIDSKLRKELRHRKPMVAGGPKLDLQLKSAIDTIASTQWIRNCVGCHFSALGSEVSDEDVRIFQTI